MGEKSEKIFASFKLSKEDGKKYDVVIKRLEDHFIIKKNKRYERFNFNKRTQGENEGAESFITQYISLLKHLNTVIYEKSLFVTV